MRTLIIGLDAFDPNVFESLLDQGKVPSLAKCVQAGGYSRFSIANPPQSEVSWTSIATGLNPGGHGIFDFVHRDPATYIPYVSLLPTKTGFAGTQFVPPFKANTIFDHVIRQGYPATSLWWPATFPARPESPVRTIPGLGTPDIFGQLGVGFLFTSDTGLASEKRKTRLSLLHQQGKGRYRGQLAGPIRKKRDGQQESALELQVELTGDHSARLMLDKNAVDLVEGKWSPVIELSFKVGLFFKIHAVTRVILTQIKPDLRLYVLPLQLHPLHSPWPYAAPPDFVRRTLKACGLYLTVGWPQDTTGLEEECINDQQFLELCDSIFTSRERILAYHLQDFREGILASVFDSLDRVQHMFWRDRPDIIEKWYLRLDEMVGRMASAFSVPGQKPGQLVVVSDHGFTRFDHKIHLNSWLIEQGYLAPKENKACGSLQDVDWSQTKAYAIGLNSIYLNLEGREGQGTVQAGEVEPLVNKLCDDLQAWLGPDGRSIVQGVWSRDKALHGELAAYGPDILVGFSPGYRGSQQTGLGSWESASIEVNQDHWGADHCIDPRAVPGVLFSNWGLQAFPNPSYLDFPALIIGEKLRSSGSAPPPTYSDEDREILEERLKSLGYL